MKFLKSKGYKRFMSMLYGIGASIVIVGALFKITHKPGADFMLTVGLLTEAVIFFFSAFETPYVDPDWSLVYPELAHQYHTKSELASLGIEAQSPSKGKVKISRGVTQELDNMLEKAKIEPELIESLGKGFRKLSENANQLSDISDASVATNSFVKNVNEASANASALGGAYKQTTETLQNGKSVTGEYLSNVQNASKALTELTGIYQNSSTSAKENVEHYNQSINAITNNLSTLNTAYELQMQNANKLQDSVEKFVNSLSTSANNTEELNKKVNQLNQKIASLNNVYGNMLAAFNVKSND